MMMMSLNRFTTPPTGMPTLRSARWYDAYPNLKMGLHLLYLAPSSSHALLGESLLQLVCQYLQIPAEASSLAEHHQQLLPQQTIRWYDQVPHLSIALALLKQLPPSAIRHIAKTWHQQFGMALTAC
jgi:hypothetical protein